MFKRLLESFGGLISEVGYFIPVSLVLCILFVFGGFYFSLESKRLEANISVLEGRFSKLLDVCKEYKSAVSVQKRLGKQPSKNIDVFDVLTKISDRLNLKDRLTGIRPLSDLKGAYEIRLEDIYMEELVVFLQELEKYGLLIKEAQIKAILVPKTDKRLIVFSARIYKKEQ